MRLRRKEGLKEFWLNFWWNTAAGILHSSYKETIDHIGFDLHHPFTLDRLSPIAHEISRTWRNKRSSSHTSGGDGMSCISTRTFAGALNVSTSSRMTPSTRPRFNCGLGNLENCRYSLMMSFNRSSSF